MLDLDFIKIDQEKIKKIKEKSIERIYKDEEMRIFVEENNLSKSFVYDHLSDFIRVLESRKNCKNCQGLKFCKTNGNCLDIEVDLRSNRTTLFLSECKSLRKRRLIADKFIICHANKEAFDYELKECASFFKEDRKLVLKELATIIKENSNQGIYIYGDEGIGKSFLLSVLSKYIVTRRKGHYLYIDLRNFIPSMVQQSLYKDKASFNEDLELLKTIDYLFLDNFGEEEKNDFSKESIICEVLNYRKEHNLPTYFTSRYSLNDLYKAYRTPKSGNFKTIDIISYIESTCKIVNIPTSSKIAKGIFE